MTVGNRIKEARSASGMSQRELARKMGVSNVALYHWENGDTQKITGHNILKLAKILSCSYQWLLTGKDGDIIDETPILGSYKFVELKEVKNLEDALKQESRGEVVFPGEYDGHSFVTRLTGNSMEPYFTENNLIKITTNRKAIHKDFVLVTNQSNGDSTIRQLIIDGQDMYLAVTNPDYPKKLTELTGDYLIIGVVSGSYTPY